MLTVPAIETTLTQNDNSESFVAALLLVSAEAVGAPLANEYKSFLKGIAGDKMENADTDELIEFKAKRDDLKV